MNSVAAALNVFQFADWIDKCCWNETASWLILTNIGGAQFVFLFNEIRTKSSVECLFVIWFHVKSQKLSHWIFFCVCVYTRNRW